VIKHVLVESNLESVLVVGLSHGLESMRHCFGIAVSAARTDFGATSDWIPR
jgi:hypothetical protein